MKSAIIVDSTATLAEKYLNHPDIYQLHLSVIFPDGQTFVDTPDEDKNKQFYQTLAESPQLPSTSQPPPAQYIELYQDLIQQSYDEVFVITLSSKISGCFQTASHLAEEFQDRIDIRLIDSKGTSFLIENMVDQALKMIEAGLEADKIEEKLNWVADHSVIYAAIEDLKYIEKGGRIRGGTAALGDLLKIKPIIYFNQEGAVEIYGAVRTSKRIKKLYKNLVDEAVEKQDFKCDIAFAHGDCLDEMLDIQAYIQADHPDLSYRLGYLTSILAVHGGPGCKGMGIIAKAPIK